MPSLEVDRNEMDFIEFYLSTHEQPVEASQFHSFVTFIWRKLKTSPQRYIIDRGSELLEKQIQKLRIFASKITKEHPKLIQNFAKKIREGIETTEFKEIIPQNYKGTTPHRTDQLDFLFRYQRSTTIRELLDILYSMDAIQTLRKIATDRNYCHPQITTLNSHYRITDFYHPCLKNPTKNNWTMENCICLFTGSNMAGKSTTLKTIAICIWLAHCGFPIPASSMKCPVLDGIFVSINLPDSLREGKSHFYAEVLRVKEILSNLESDKKFFILFDELFKGTNAKDAFEASDAVIELLKKKNNISSIISTHIIELALKYEPDEDCCFYYLESEIKDNQLLCYHKLNKGISESRVGYWIVRKELFS